MSQQKNTLVKRISFVLIALAVAVMIFGAAGYRFLFPVLPKAAAPKEVVRLDQGWMPDQREKYYQTSQGSLIIPYSWFMALEQPGLGNHEPFAAEENLLRYDLVPDSSKYNPDHLPVGVGKESIDDDHLRDLGCGAPPCPAGSSLHKEWLTYTCAACHTAQINYQGKSFIIEGGRGRWNFNLFNTTLANLLLVTLYSPGMFDRFADKVISYEKRPNNPDEKEKVKHELDEFVHGPSIVNGLMGSIKNTYPTEEGFGRMDALGRGANGQFAPLDKRNILVANAPVVIPPLWYTHDYDWVQSVAAIGQPLGRNVTESWGVNSAVDLTNSDPSQRFHSSIPIRNMFWMETLVSVMKAPQWPEEILGKVDPEAVKLGRYLYEEKIFDNALTPAEEQWCPDAAAADGYEPCPNPNMENKGLCARCHGPAGQVNVNENGKRYFQLPMYKLSVIGTDPGDAVNFNGRQVYTGVLRSTFGGKDKVGVGEALLVTTSAIMAREMDQQHIPPEDRLKVTGFRKNDFRAPLAYPARPLTGYWSTPPYMHNGAIPNLYEVMSPASERSATFWTGSEEFDPAKVGYRTEKFEGGFRFDTKRTFAQAAANSVRELFSGHLRFDREIAGNSNLGHEFRDAPKGTPGVIGPYLSPKERMAIIEYMKVMPEVKPLDDGSEYRYRIALLKDMEPEYNGDVQTSPAK
jgi:cytochrome c553